MKKLKLCVDCRWFQKSEGGAPLCNHEDAVHVNLVTGQQTRLSCRSLREMLEFGCTRDGKWFEPKEASDD